MLTLSRWKLTFDRAGTPLVMVDGSMMAEAEIGFPWQQDAADIAPIGAMLATRESRGNAVDRVRFTAVREHESAAAARLWCIQLQTTLNTYSAVTSTLLLEVPGQGTRYELASATIDAVDAAVSLSGGRPRTIATWEVGGCGWEELPEPGVYHLPALPVEMVNDSEANWMEVYFISPDLLSGTAATGWTWSAGDAPLRAFLEQSDDLMTWQEGQFVDVAGSPEAVTDGWEYRARAITPSRWNSVMCDLTMTSDRAGKSITQLRVKNTAVSLPGYPYAMPSAAATLQTHLRAAGYTGATVTSTSVPLYVTIKNHTPGRAELLQSTVSGGGVTQVRAYISGTWTPISLPSYPYALPSAKATLQTHLRAAGYTGAVVKLHGDEWTIHLPDVAAGATNRSINADITPADPFPAWDAFLVYQGEAPDNIVVGTSGNVRTPAGAPLLEYPRQFARLRVIPAP
jgi:hypothetical protein